MKDIKQIKVAILHDFLVQFGGAEKTLEAICEIFPNADVFTAKFDSKCIEKSKVLKSMNIIGPKANWMSKVSKYFFTFLMALIFEEFNFNGYDIVISEGTAWPKGALTKPNQLHISYIHTPPRFLYGYSTESTKRNKWYFKLIFSYIDNILRLWDFVAAQRPDFIVTNSNETKERINKFYRREAKVIYPPVNTTHKNLDEKNIDNEVLNSLPQTFFLCLGRLVAYKNFDLVIGAFNELKKPLVIVGGGSFEKDLKSMAKDNIVFLGKINDETLSEVIRRAKGAVNAVADEDFGIVPLEIMSHGVPVLAHKSAGHLETVKEGVSGLYFEELSTTSLVNKINEFEKLIDAGSFDKQEIIKSVQGFSTEKFKEEFLDFVTTKWNEHNARGS